MNYNWYNELSAVSQLELLILRLAWLNLWDEHMTTGRINQVDGWRDVHERIWMNLFVEEQETLMKSRRLKTTLGNNTWNSQQMDMKHSHLCIQSLSYKPQELRMRSVELNTQIWSKARTFSRREHCTNTLTFSDLYDRSESSISSMQRCFHT